MQNRKTPDSDTLSGETASRGDRATISASDVGVTLRISDEALQELDRIQEENIKAAQEDQKFSWR